MLFIAKFDFAIRIVEMDVKAKKKVVMFFQQNSFMDAMDTALGKRGIGRAILKGDTATKENTIKLWKGFLPVKVDCDVLLSTIQTGGTGLNLTEAHTIIIYTPSDNPTTDWQAIHRAYRIGLLHPINVYRLVTARSVESKIVLRQARKEGLSEALLEKNCYLKAEHDKFNTKKKDDHQIIFRSIDPQDQWSEVLLQIQKATEEFEKYVKDDVAKIIDKQNDGDTEGEL